MNKRATIEDVARIAGVSTATVSRTIHTPEVVSDSTRKAVFGAIDQTGYTLNLAARNLRQQKANAVLVLVPDIGNTFFSEILSGIERVASEAGQTILIGDTANDQRRAERLLNGLINGQADGALILNGNLPASVVERLKSGPGTLPPIVSVSEALSPQSVPHVGIDNTAAAWQATAYLLGRGHKEIVHLRGPTGNILTRQRAAGFQGAMKAAGQPVGPDSYLSGDFTIESGILAAAELRGRPSLPSAVFCANDEMAIGLISGLSTAGIKVPEDVSVFGFDDIAFAKASIPGLTTIRQPRGEIGARAMQRLLRLIKGKGADEHLEDILAVELVERQSVKDCHY